MPRRLSNWLTGYLVYTNESESPEEFHLWMGISAIAGVLRRKCYFNMGYFTLYPNLYVVLVSPAGRCKKSTAMRISRAFGEAIPGIAYSVDSTSRERMIQDLSQSFKDGQSCLNVHSTEFASMLTTSGMDMVVFLTDIFDSPNEWTHKTKGGGTNRIKAPFVNLVGAATPEWIAKGLPLDTIGIGLTSRIVFIYQDTPRKRPPFPELSPEQKALYDLLVEDLATISAIDGEFIFNEEAREIYKIWYEARFDDPNPSKDPRMAGYYERKPMHLIKLCMVVSAAKRDDRIITEEDLVEAMQLFDRAEALMPRVFSSVGKNPLFADQEAMIADFMQNPQGFTLPELLERFSYSVRQEELVEIVNTLTTMGKIRNDGKRYVIVR